MKVSVICPTYNRFYTLKRAVESFLEQDYEDKELLILNDGSNDSTADYLKTLSHHGSLIRVFNKERGSVVNVGANLNFLWSQCKGDLICQLHDDDRLYAGSLTARVNIFKKRKDLNVVYGSVMQFYNDKAGTQFIKAEAPDSNEIIYRDYINFTTLMWVRDLKFMFDETLVYELDHLFKVRCLNECQVDYTIEPVMWYAIHEGQETRRGNLNGEIVKEKEIVREKIRTLYFKS